MQFRRKVLVVAGLAAFVAAVLAAGFAGKPVIRDHESVVDGPYPSNWCGQVDGTQIDTGTFTFWQDATGAFHSTNSFRSVFTANATGKQLELSDAGVDMGTGVDNSDGTTTFTEHSAGLVIRFKILDGGVLKGRRRQADPRRRLG